LKNGLKRKRRLNKKGMKGRLGTFIDRGDGKRGISSQKNRKGK